MAQPETPASASRHSIISPLAGGMTTAQLEQVLQRTPQMTRFNPLRRHLRAPKTPNSRISKSEIIASDDEAATTSPSAPIVQPPKSLNGEAIRVKGKEVSVAIGGDDVDQGTSKFIDTLHPSSHENVSRSKQLGETLPKRFLRTIAKRKKSRREQRIASKPGTILSAEEPSSKSSHGKKGEEKAILTSSGSGRPAELNRLFKNPDPLSDESSDGSQESTSLEELIRTTSRTFNSQPSSDHGTRDISFSFGAPRLVRRTIMGSHKKVNNSNNLDDLELEILGLPDATHSSDCTPGPSDSQDDFIDHHTSQKCDRPRPMKRQKKRVNKRPRRLPVDELHLVSESVAGFSQENDENGMIKVSLSLWYNIDQSIVEPSAEILDDPISQDSSDALKIVQSVGRTKGEKKLFQTYHGAFGNIDSKAFRFPNRYNTSPRAESSNRHEVSSSHSDGFVGAEANPTGRCMLLPRQKRACISIWGLTTRIAQLELVREKVHGLVDELNSQAERRVPAKNTKRRLKKKATLNASVMMKLESQADKTGESQQDDQDSQSHENRDAHQDDQSMRGYLSGDEMISVAEVNSLSPPTRKGSRRVIFDERIEIDRRVRIPSLDSENPEDSFEVKRRKTSSDSAVWHNMETVRLNRCHDEDSEQDVLSINELKRSIISISSDNDEMEESDGSGGDSGEETGDEDEAEDENEHENEGESGECFNVLGVREKQSDELIDGNILSTEDESSEQSQQCNGKDDDRDEFYASEEETILNKPVGGEEEITEMFVSKGLVRNKKICPIDESLVQESQTTRTEGKDNSQLSQLSIAMSWHNSTQVLKIPEADDWRPRRPKSSDVMNETQEDIFDSSSPISTIAKRRSTGLQVRRWTAFRGRPLALTVGKPPTPPSPKIPETQIVAPKIPETRLIAVRDISPELGESQVSNTPNEFNESIPDALLLTSNKSPLHSSQLSFIPDEIPEETFFCRASQVLGEHKTPVSRSKSTPGRFYPAQFKSIATPIYAQPNTETTESETSAPSMSPKFSQQSYRPTPKSEKSLSRLTRQASSALGTLPGSARKRTKTLPFKPPFKKPILKI
ncbi:uncharacterized protein Bfra_005943 [Botrytis fragariae]|uniref:Uncharacterized protein n=1 Tax=Botrytis fragariae TaxID=1964551 RepID=A0A8H6EHL1_9HELO|nr:uncharacterized protein Bfra_005943 [Botrytis fragariae]KAF5872582.1 hypothetical protein Bfra_005943 [Botrytis fragariae]